MPSVVVALAMMVVAYAVLTDTPLKTVFVELAVLVMLFAVLFGWYAVIWAKNAPK